MACLIEWKGICESSSLYSNKDRTKFWNLWFNWILSSKDVNKQVWIYFSTLKTLEIFNTTKQKNKDILKLETVTKVKMRTWKQIK